MAQQKNPLCQRSGEWPGPGPISVPLQYFCQDILDRGKYSMGWQRVDMTERVHKYRLYSLIEFKNFLCEVRFSCGSILISLLFCYSFQLDFICRNMLSFFLMLFCIFLISIGISCSDGKASACNGDLGSPGLGRSAATPPGQQFKFHDQRTRWVTSSRCTKSWDMTKPTLHH